METNSLIDSGRHYHEYKVVLTPNENIQQKVMEVKREFSDRYKTTAALFSKPHITLLQFAQSDMREDLFISRLNTLCWRYAPFKVDLKDYGNYPAHTIFFNIESKQRVGNLIRELKPVRQLITLDKQHKPHFIDHPCLLLAGNLLPWQYEKGWEDFRNRSFTGSFIAAELLLLKRPFNANGYRTLQVFKMMNEPVVSKQRSLFM